MSEVLSDWITTQEAANLSGYDQAHIRKLAMSGSVRAFKRGRDWFISRDSIKVYVEKMKKLGTLKHSPKKEN